MLIAELDIEMYLEDFSPPDFTAAEKAEEAMSYAAAAAFGRMVDGEATVEDLAAYRAWMTYCRMTHMTHEDLAGARAVADDWAQKLGVE